MEEGPSSTRIGRRRFLKLVTIMGGGIMLVSCGPNIASPTPTVAPAGPTITPATPTAPATPKVSANIGFAATSGGIGPQMIPLLVAQELFFPEEGIVQKVTPFQSSGDTVRATVTGGQQLGQPSPSSVAIAAEEGQPIRIIADYLPFASIFWVVKPDSPLKSMKDLKGKKLGYSRAGSVSQTYALAALRAAGLNPDQDVTMVAAGSAPDQLAAVQGGTIDAGWLTDPLLTQELLKQTIRVLAPSYEMIPLWSENMLATTVDYTKSSGDILTAYLRAHQKAMDFIRNEPGRTAEIWAKGQGMTADVASAALKNYPVQKFTSKIDPAILKAIADDMLANKQIKDAPAWGQIVDQSFMAPDLRVSI